ncbi:11607_t:CDS:2, partial [Gigaspora rosea]
PKDKKKQTRIVLISKLPIFNNASSRRQLGAKPTNPPFPWGKDLIKCNFVDKNIIFLWVNGRWLKSTNNVPRLTSVGMKNGQEKSRK